MPITARQVIDQAREIHPAFDARRNPPGVVLRALSRTVEDLVSELARIAPEAVQVDGDEVPLPLVPFEGGYPIPVEVVRLVHARVRIGEESWYPLTLVPSHQRFTPALWPAAREQGGVIYLLGLERDWTAYTALQLTYVPLPAALTALDADLPVPDDARQLLVWSLAEFMAGRTPDTPGARPIAPGYYAAQAEGKRGMFLDRMAARTVQVAQTPSVW